MLKQEYSRSICFRFLYVLVCFGLGIRHDFNGLAQAVDKVLDILDFGEGDNGHEEKDGRVGIGEKVRRGLAHLGTARQVRQPADHGREQADRQGKDKAADL